jgi:phage baseplate assembly protein W
LIQYSDFTTDFSIHPIKKDLVSKTNEQAVTQSIRNLLKTNYYNRPFNPRVGSNLRAALFELDTEFTIITVRNAVKELITIYETRAEIINIDVTSDPYNYSYIVQLTYALINKNEPIVVSIALERIR